MSALAERTMLTRSGITRLVDGLVAADLIRRVACPNDARISYAQLTDTGYEKLRRAGCSHVASIKRMFVEHFTREELAVLAELLGRRRAPPTGSARSPERASAPARSAWPALLLTVAATWRSGYAAACKAVYTGSIPVVASHGRPVPRSSTEHGYTRPPRGCSSVG